MWSKFQNPMQNLMIGCCMLSLVACGGGGHNSGGTPSAPAPVANSSAASVGGVSGTDSTNMSSSSSSAQSSFTSSKASNQALVAPQAVSVVTGNSSVKLDWNLVADATTYSVYYATQANILSKNISAFENGTWVTNVKPPYTINGLQNNKTYYFVVTATKNSEESPQSVEVSATPTADELSHQPTPQEVLLVELINRARFDPAAEAARYGISLNDGISGTTVTAERKPPLAHNLMLIDSARLHSQWMLDADIFSHTGNNNSTPTDRMTTAGYRFTGSWANGENISWSGTTASSINITQQVFNQHEGLFKSPGHRINILGTDCREVGAGLKQGRFLNNGIDYLASMLTEDFARSGDNYFLTGVVYEDLNNNQFYDVGEGLDHVTVTINGTAYPVYASGAYSIPLPKGTYDVAITGDSLASAVNYRVQISNSNVKLDVIKTGATAQVISW